MSMTILTQFYGLTVSDDQKEKLVNGLTGIDPVEGGPFIADIPSLVFCLHLLRTETNIDKVREVVEALSLVYLNTIGKRIDPLSCSNIMSGWAEVGMHNE